MDPRLYASGPSPTAPPPALTLRRLPLREKRKCIVLLQLVRQWKRPSSLSNKSPSDILILPPLSTRQLRLFRAYLYLIILLLLQIVSLNTFTTHPTYPISPTSTLPSPTKIQIANHHCIPKPESFNFATPLRHRASQQSPRCNCIRYPNHSQVYYNI